MSSRKRRIEALQKRADHLAARIASSEKLELTFDKRELGALKWAIRELSAHRAELDASDAKDAARYRAVKACDWIGLRIAGQEFIGVSNLDAWADVQLSQLPHGVEPSHPAAQEKDK